MSKRPASPAASSSSSSSGDSEPSFINVDFLFSSPSALDYHALKRLTQQLFYTHAAHLDLGAIAQETIDAAGKWGSVVKVDQQSEEGGEEEDPYAFVGAFDLAASTAASQSLRAYFLARSASCASISSLLASSSADAANAAASPSTLLVLHERMVNLPPAIALPLYRMLFDEIAASPTQPDNLLFFSRIFNADAFSDDEMSDAEGGDAEDKPRGMKGAAKKRRKAAASLKTAKTAPPPKARLAEGEYGLFHPEDAVFAQFASHTHTFRFPPPPDASEAFEAPLFGRLVVVPWRQAAQLLQRLEALLAQGGAA